MFDQRAITDLIGIPKRGLIVAACISSLLGACVGQQPCSAEAKLLLAPGDAKSVMQALDGGQPSGGRVFLYDTEARDLLAHGILLRVRQGANSSDLTVKLRVPEKKAIANTPVHRDRFKCEIDRAGDTEAYSYSVQARLKATIPRTGAELYQRLSASQRQLLELAGLDIDWSKVKNVAEIRSTDWPIADQPPLGKLDLELWQWAGSAVLELSAKTDPASLQAACNQLRNLAIRKALSLAGTQQFKTEIVLRTSH